MSNDAPPLPTPAAPPPAPAPKPADDLGIDNAFLMSMARVPFIAVGFTAIAVIVTWLVPKVGLTPQVGMVALISLGMIVAAVIDAWAFKVPNWLTLSLVVSGWLIGLLYNFGLPLDPKLVKDGMPLVGVGSALLGTGLGLLLLGPMLLIGGMGQGDVKMQMGFGSWVGVIFAGNTTPDSRVFLGLFGANDSVSVIVCGFVLGAFFGGLMGLTMMAMRRQFAENAGNLREIVTDLQILVTAGPEKAAARAGKRRPRWARLPYGVPLCIGFLVYLGWLIYDGNLTVWMPPAGQ